LARITGDGDGDDDEEEGGEPRHVYCVSDVIVHLVNRSLLTPPPPPPPVQGGGRGRNPPNQSQSSTQSQSQSQARPGHSSLTVCA